MTPFNQLAALRSHGPRRTLGLPDAVIERFLKSDLSLAQAIGEAYTAYEQARVEFPELLNLPENEQLKITQGGFVNFYSDDTVNPYVAIAARGPWVISLKGAVIHDNGGYGMLGAGHGPQAVIDAMARPQVMANIMTASLSQLRLERALRREIGHTRGGCPYAKFLCLNSGSETVTLAGRLSDVNTKLMTAPGAPHAGRKVRRIAVRGAFHGRTELPALYSDSSKKAYNEHLASFAHHQHTLIVEPYDVAHLRQTFAEAESAGFHIEAMFIEPVMGEGNPGRALTPEFYAVARELTKKHHSLLLADSIQSGLRAHGVLSIVDYPGFETLEAPDLETYSKALNAGQYPLSVLAANERAAALYRKGIYGNTMTTNPRAMDVACTVLDGLTPALRQNIRERGAEFLRKLEALARELPGMITNVQGTGLLFSCELSAEFKCYGTNSTEEFMREHGLGVIHGGANSLRFTPHFAITSEEVDLVIDNVRRALVSGPRLSMPAAQAA